MNSFLQWQRFFFFFCPAWDSYLETEHERKTSNIKLQNRNIPVILCLVLVSDHSFVCKSLNSHKAISHFLHSLTHKKTGDNGSGHKKKTTLFKKIFFACFKSIKSITSVIVKY